MNRLSSILIFLFFVLPLAFGSFFIWQSLRPPASDERIFIAFKVSPSESFLSVCNRLESEKLIQSASALYYLGRLTGESGRLKAGEYEISNQMSAWEVLKVITGGHTKLYRVTIREGMNIFQVSQLLDDLNLVEGTQFLEAAWDPTLLDELSIPSFSVEGYLFPETYYIPRGSSPRNIIRILVDMFWNQVGEDMLTRASEMKMSFHEIVIMASVIEKETGLIAEMDLISSVFYNRLRKGMKIQSDPTAVYDLLPYGGKVTREHLFRKTLYNTYQIRALPVAPISNPGIRAIRAALYPKKSEYLFFVSRRDGSHHFSETYEEHNEAIDRYLR